MGKRYKHKRRKATSGDWERLTEDAILRSAYLQFAKSVKSAQETAVIRASSSGLPAQHFIDLREAGRILDQHPQLVNYLASIRERQEAIQSAQTISLDTTKASPIGTTPQSANLGGWAGYNDRNQPQGVPNARMLRDWVEQSEWATSAIDYYRNRISRADAAIMPYDERKPYNKPIEKTLQGILEHPNSLGDTWSRLLYMGVGDYLTLGRMMFSKNMNAKRQAIELYAEDAALIRIYPAWDGSDPAQARYLYTDDNGRTKIPLRNDEIICILDGVSTYKFSQSRVQTLRNTIIADLRATESAARLVEQKPPPHLIQIPGASPEQIGKIRAAYDSDLAGRREVLWLGGPNPAQVRPLVFSLKDNQWMEWLEYLARKFAVVFSLSLTHFSFTGDVNRATSTTQSDISEEKGLIPMMLNIEEEINNGFVADYAPKVKGRPDIQALNLRFMFPEISEAARMMHASTAIELASKSLAGLPSQTINMVLAAMGQPPIPGGNTLYTNSANGPIPWLSYDGDYGNYTSPLGVAVGEEDPAGSPGVDETADEDMGNSNDSQSDDTGNGKASPDTTTPAETVTPDQSIDPSANASEKRYKDYRLPGKRWSPSLLTRQQSRPEPQRLPEDVQARKQLEETVKRIFADVEKRAKKQLEEVSE